MRILPRPALDGYLAQAGSSKADTFILVSTTPVYRNVPA